MNTERFKFRYVFVKDFGGKTGICYKMPIFNLDTITNENFNKIIQSYIDYNYRLISIEQATGLKDINYIGYQRLTSYSIFNNKVEVIGNKFQNSRPLSEVK